MSTHRRLSHFNRLGKSCHQQALRIQTTSPCGACIAVPKLTFSRYTFPLYNGVSVVEFTCQIGERTIKGLVKERDEAKRVYRDAVRRGQTAGILEQLPAASDVFTTTIGNVPPSTRVIITIRYNGELKHDAEVDGIRFTIPTTIAPRYGSYPGELMEDAQTTRSDQGFQITVDATMAEDSPIQKIQSSSHPISISIGTLSTAPSEDANLTKGSATLTLGTTALEKDFVLQIVAKNLGTPRAILETHPTIPNQRALMTTLVPKFTLKPQHPEIIFLADRSGSMENNVKTLISALQVFLKSLPVGVRFNICSFGSSHEFLWKKSQAYSRESLEGAMTYVRSFKADFGGTEIFSAMKAAIDRRFGDLPTEILLLTDGDIWNQEDLFKYLKQRIAMSKQSLRVFTLGIGNGASSALIEGVARAGNGFAQTVNNGERMDRKIVRMLKAALTPHITDYSLEVKYKDANCGAGYEVVDRVADSLKVNLSMDEKNDEAVSGSEKKPISLYDADIDTNAGDKDSDCSGRDSNVKDSYAHLPNIVRPKLLQSPHKIPPLFPFSRTTVYLLMSPETSYMTPVSVTLKATSAQGPLELVLPVEVLEQPGETIHQLAARNAIQELEEGRGWITELKDQEGKLIANRYPGRFDEMVEREAVRLGVEFQVGGKWCSFVAVEANDVEIAKKKSRVPQMAGVETSANHEEDDFEMVDQEPPERAFLSSPSPPRQRDLAASGPESTVNWPEQRFSAAPRSGSVAPRWRGPVTRGPLNRGSVAISRTGKHGGFRIYDSQGIIGGCDRSVSTERQRGPAREACVSKSAPTEDNDMVDFSDEDMGICRFLRDRSPSHPKKMKGSAGTSTPEKIKLEGQALLHHLIDAQTFTGNWELGSLPRDAMGFKEEPVQLLVQELASQFGVGDDKAAEAVATAMVVVFLERRMAEEHEAWELLVDKARAWLEGKFGGDLVERVGQAQLGW